MTKYVVWCEDYRAEFSSPEEAERVRTAIEKSGNCPLEHRIEIVESGGNRPPHRE